MKPTDRELESIRLADWSGFTDFGGERDVYAPGTEAEVVDLVRYCRENGKKLRVVGLQTSWNSLWYSEDVMMTTKHLNRILDIDPAEPHHHLRGRGPPWSRSTRRSGKRG